MMGGINNKDNGLPEKEREVILIIGASSDLGIETIRSIFNKDTIIIAHYNSSGERINSLVKEFGASIVPIKADLTKHEEVSGLIEFVKNNYQPTKFIQFASPPLILKRFKEIEWPCFQEQLDVQLKSSALILREILPFMAKKEYGKVLFILSSVTQGAPPKMMADYVTAKYALLGLAKALASEYADKHICVNSISPSMMETRFIKGVPEKLVEMEAERNLGGRNVKPQDVIPLISFLLSNKSDFITGANIPVSGGSVF